MEHLPLPSPFPREIPYVLDFERRKVNDIINYFNNQPIQCHCESHKYSISTYEFCQKAEKEYSGNLTIFKKVASVIKKIHILNSKGGLREIRKLINEEEPKLLENSNFLFLQIIYFVKAFLIEYVERDPNEAIKDYCKCFILLSQSSTKDYIVIEELRIRQELILNYQVVHDPQQLILGDNIKVLKDTFDKVLPTLVPKDQVKLENFLGQLFMSQNQFEEAKETFHKMVEIASNNSNDKIIGIFIEIFLDFSFSKRLLYNGADSKM